MTSDAYLAGELAVWPDKGRMASLLRSAGLRVSVGRHSIRIADFSHFVFQEYGGDLGEPRIEADADSAEILASEAQRISDVLSGAGLVHRFEIYQDGIDEIKHYFHFGWPPNPDG